MNIIHRDLNPRNILVTDLANRELKLIDFGTAKYFYGGLPDEGHTVIVVGGGIEFTPPWQLKGEICFQNDLYTVAADLFFMVTGMRPQPPGSPLNDPRRYNPTISDRLASIILKGLQPDPSMCFSSATEFRAALLGVHPPPQALPYLWIGAMKYFIRGSKVIVGRNPKNNFIMVLQEDGSYEDVLLDKERYVSRYAPSFGKYGQIEIYRSGSSWLIERKSSVNMPAIYRGGAIHKLDKVGATFKLQDGDVIALAYDDSKGPYITLTFKVR